MIGAPAEILKLKKCLAPRPANIPFNIELTMGTPQPPLEVFYLSNCNNLPQIEFRLRLLTNCIHLRLSAEAFALP